MEQSIRQAVKTALSSRFVSFHYLREAAKGIYEQTVTQRTEKQVREYVP